jgi:uncharacterized repeat protein (TIGR03803 family)
MTEDFDVPPGAGAVVFNSKKGRPMSSSTPDHLTRRGLLIVACATGLLSSGCGSSGSDPAVSTYTVGGTVSGLAAGAQLELLDNGQDPLMVAGGGTFKFPTALPSSSQYQVTVATAPGGQTCTVAGGSGAIAAANIANVVVTCSDRAFSLGGTVQGLNASGLMLQNGTDSLAVPAGTTSFTMPQPVAYTSSYSLAVMQQPNGVTCSVRSGSGTMPASDITSVVISCSDQPFTLGGSVSGLGAAAGLVLANGAETLSVPAFATGFTFPGRVLFGTPYQVTVQSVPASMQCVVSDGAGTMPAGPVNTVAVACSPNTYPVGGSVSGLSASGLILTDGRDPFGIDAGATAFIMPMTLPTGARYALSVQTQPSGLTCAVGNGSGTVGAAPVTNIAVTCAASAFTVGGSVSGLTTSGLVLTNGGDSLSVLANAMEFSMPVALPSGTAYDVAVGAHPPARTCTVTNGSGTVGSADVNDVAVSCVPGSESVLHLFQADPSDGVTPYGSLVRGSDGSLYGLTDVGGANGLGMAFMIAPDGTETVLYSFSGGADGANPHGSLIQGSDGNFYGMTVNGGAFDAGVLFVLTPAGTESVLHSFGSGAGGQYPYGSLVQASDGNFYGMSMYGGAYGLGAVFMIRPDGGELVIHSFGSGADGQRPSGTLVQGGDGNLYGMTAAGGDFDGGIVFSMTLQGAETILHSLGSGTDGAAPAGSLIQASDGSFYGLTRFGGVNGAGALIRVNGAGDESVVASLGGGIDGTNPCGDPLQASDGNLYVLTSNGGANGDGAVLQFSLSGTESVVYSFAGGADGQGPSGALIESPDGTLYGTTSGGRVAAGGTVFQID